MVKHLYTTFLDDPFVYQQAVTYWVDLWTALYHAPSYQQTWITPWLSTGAPTIRDGNPIFSAYAPALRRGLRVVQYAPASCDTIECDYWFDRHGGDRTDPHSIHELVITLALSEEASRWAQRLIAYWLVLGPDEEY